MTDGSRIKVLFFAAARERAGCREDWLEVPDAERTVERVLSLLADRFPELRSLLPHLRVAVNQEFVDRSAVVPGGAEVALIPPVAGGSGMYRVVDRVLSLDEVVQAVASKGYGGLVTFTGTVRDHTRGRRVTRLEYEAYAPMAEGVMARIGDEASAKWPGARLAIVHRVGVLEPGEAAVVIAAAAPHRGEAFRTCEYAIERLKQDVPIWKREVYEDGEVWVGLGP